MATQKLSKEEIARRARNAEYSRKHRLKKAKLALAGKKDAAAAPAPARNGNGLEEVILDTQAKIRARTERLMHEALEAGADGKTVQEIMASFQDAAGKDPESEALVRLLSLLKQADSLRRRIKAKDFGQPSPAGEAKRKNGTAAAARKRA